MYLSKPRNLLARLIDFIVTISLVSFIFFATVAGNAGTELVVPNANDLVCFAPAPVAAVTTLDDVLSAPAP